MAIDVLNKDIDKFYQILDQVAVPETKNIYRIKPEVGSGKFHCYCGNNWDLYVGDFELFQDIHFQRFPDYENKGQYSISFQTFKGRADESEWNNDTLKKAGEGIVFYSNQAKVNSMWHKNTKCNMVYLAFNINWIKQLEQEVLLPNVIRKMLLEIENPMFHVPLTTDTKHSVRQIFYPPKEISDEFLSAYLYNKSVELFIQAAGGTVQRVNRQVKQFSIHPDDLNILEQIKIQLINNYQEPPLIKELVETTGMSKSKLQRSFQSVYGTSVYQFIKSVRMEKAMGLLMQGYSVTEAGYDVGYSSIPNFSAAFKEHFNILPGQVASR